LVRFVKAIRRALKAAQETQVKRQSTGTEVSRTAAEAQSRQHAERLKALSRIAHDATLHGPNLVHPMLRYASDTIRPGQAYDGVLGRIEGTELVLMAVVGDFSAAEARSEKVLKVGDRTEIAKTLLLRRPHPDRTQTWDDLSTVDGLSESVRGLGWRAGIATQFIVGELTYSLMFGSPTRATRPLGEQDRAYVEVLAAFLANTLQVHQLEESLSDSEERSRQHAERLEALWRIVNNPTLRDENLWLAMLRQAAAAIRPGQAYRGMLSGIAGSEMVFEAIVEAPGREDPDDLPPPAGSTFPLAGSRVAQMLEQGGTRSWDDVPADEGSRMRVNRRGRAFIATPFDAGGSKYVLSFGSTEPTIKAFGPQDHTYIEVLASFFTNNIQQRWQFDRIQYQQSHDALTGLLNRSQFRSRARAASVQCNRFAVVLVDIDGFAEINDSYGNMIGDAVLVEVGASLRERASAEEIIARVGGDVFGIYVPNPISKEDAQRRALDFGEVFARSFSAGDREGKQFIALTASLGVGAAPEDGTTLDAIVSNAQAALSHAKEQRHHGRI
jgi:diguanylate cyclase (GGDEF)-like protein